MAKPPAPRAALLQNLEIRDVVHPLSGRRGQMLILDQHRLVISHQDDGAIDLVVLRGDVALQEFRFPPDVADALVEWAAGPSRAVDEDAPDASLQFCTACFNGRCDSCKGHDVCQCTHNAAHATSGRGPRPQ